MALNTHTEVCRRYVITWTIVPDVPSMTCSYRVQTIRPEERGATLEENLIDVQVFCGTLESIDLLLFWTQPQPIENGAEYSAAGRQKKTERREEDNESSFVATKVAICMESQTGQKMFHSNY
jgi:hypothetical protein